MIECKLCGWKGRLVVASKCPKCGSRYHLHYIHEDLKPGCGAIIGLGAVLAWLLVAAVVYLACG